LVPETRRSGQIDIEAVKRPMTGGDCRTVRGSGPIVELPPNAGLDWVWCKCPNPLDGM